MEILVENSIHQDTLKGLSSKPKYLLSKYFYDEAGSRIFCDIMRMPEYYLTNCEYEIFNTQKRNILKSLGHPEEPFDLVELGAGDGFKTKILLEHMLIQGLDFTYVPVDIASKALHDLQQDIQASFPDIRINAINNTYFESLQLLKNQIDVPKIILFLGSSIGNFSFNESATFLTHLGSVMNRKDKIIIGFDLKKDPRVILKAYDDPHGHTRAFNLNLLERMNRELGAHFRTNRFQHFENYEPLTGVAKSYLISTLDQDVYIEAFQQSFHFQQWEPIYTEMSQKYDTVMIERLAAQSGFEIASNFSDHREYFVNSVWGLKET